MMRLLNEFLPETEHVQHWMMEGKQYPSLPDDKVYEVQEQFLPDTALDVKMAVIEIFKPHECHEMGQVLEASVVIDYDWSKGHANAKPILAPESPKTELAECLLEAYQRLLKDESYRQRLEEHCLWMKRVGTIPKKSTAHQTKKIGRNDRCECGSGKKHKKCCLRK